MTKPQSTRKTATPKPSEEFSKAADPANGNVSPYGFHMVDDMTVMERKPLPGFGAPDAAIVNVYDFKNLELMTYMQAAGPAAAAPQVFLRPFADLNSGYGIAEARAALEDLGGHPPPLQMIPGFAPPPGSQRTKNNTLPELK